MADTILRLTIEPTYGIGPGEKTRIDIVEKAGEEYQLRLTEQSVGGDRSTTKHPVPTIEVENMIGKLTTTAIPALAMGEFVCGGDIFTLELHYWDVRSKFTWLTLPPEEWDVLAEVADRLCSLAGLDE